MMHDVDRAPAGWFARAVVQYAALTPSAPVRPTPHRRRGPAGGALALQRAVGNRATGAILRHGVRTLARDVEAEQAALEAQVEPSITQLAAQVKGIGGDERGFKFQNLLWRLISNYAPDSSDSLVQTRYDRTVKGFAVKDVAEGKGAAYGVLVAGDDVIERAAAGKVTELAEELRGALWQIQAADLKAGRKAVVWIGRERVRVSSADEKAQAERIVKDVKENYGVTFDSIATRRAARAQYAFGGATEDQLRALDAAPWEYKELQAVEKALKHFAPILGKARKRSSLKSSPQEVVNFGKLTASPDDDPTKIGDATRGEYFRKDRAATLYEEPANDRLSEFDPLAFERSATHEIAHGVFDPHLAAFMKMTGYWAAKLVRKPKAERAGAEAPPDAYASRNAGEDLAQSVAYYFTDRKRLKEGDGRSPAGEPGNPCPRRLRFIQGIVGDW
jgi:hypothetical protein